MKFHISFYFYSQARQSDTLNQISKHSTTVRISSTTGVRFQCSAVARSIKDSTVLQGSPVGGKCSKPILLYFVPIIIRHQNSCSSSTHGRPSDGEVIWSNLCLKGEGREGIIQPFLQILRYMKTEDIVASLQIPQINKIYDKCFGKYFNRSPSLTILNRY